jgi:hypothetical protein
MEGVASDTIYHWFQNGFDAYVREYFKGAGYEVVGSNSLREIYGTAVNAKTPSVVVFADNESLFR